MDRHNFMDKHNFIVGRDETMLVTGANGFVGSAVVERLLAYGFDRIRAFCRPASDTTRLDEVILRHEAHDRVEVVKGNLLVPDDCHSAVQDVSVLYHLAAGTGEKSYANAYLNSVVTTRNLLEAACREDSFKRFVNTSSIAVYTNKGKPGGAVLDESCPIEPHPELRGEAYLYAKAKQDEIVREYGKECGISYVLVRPGVVYGPGKAAITGRVGIDTFGMFLHLGGPNRIPFTYVENCAEAIVLAGLVPEAEGEVFNILDDELPSSRQFLRQYKKNVKRFRSIYLPHSISYLLSWGWEGYANWSRGQLPPVFNRRRWYANWKSCEYRNDKLKTILGWKQLVPTQEGLERYFAGCRR